jgi:hypothetical protein
VLWAIEKTAIKYVALNRAEGPSAECRAIVYYVGQKPQAFEDERHFNDAGYVECKDSKAVYDAVLNQFFVWGRSAPKPGNGYDKCDFEVGWENGQVYDGRFDIQEGGRDGDQSFWVSLKWRLEFYSLRRRPSHFKDAHWKHFCEQMKEDGGDEYCGRILDECQLYAA